MTLSAVVTGLVDYQFKVELQRRYHAASALASVLGLFYSAVSLAALAVQLFLTRGLIRRLGAGWSAGLLPAGLGLGAALTIALPGLASVLLTRLWDLVLRFSVNRVAGELFYFPLEVRELVADSAEAVRLASKRSLPRRSSANATTASASTASRGATTLRGRPFSARRLPANSLAHGEPSTTRGASLRARDCTAAIRIGTTPASRKTESAKIRTHSRV